MLLFYSKQDARMVELVDTPDLKSCALFGRAGSSPAPSTFKKKALYHSDTGLFGSTITENGSIKCCFLLQSINIILRYKIPNQLSGALPLKSCVKPNMVSSNIFKVLNRN